MRCLILYDRPVALCFTIFLIGLQPDLDRPARELDVHQRKYLRAVYSGWRYNGDLAGVGEQLSHQSILKAVGVIGPM